MLSGVFRHHKCSADRFFPANTMDWLKDHFASLCDRRHCQDRLTPLTRHCQPSKAQADKAIAMNEVTEKGIVEKEAVGEGATEKETTKTDDETSCPQQRTFSPTPWQKKERDDTPFPEERLQTLFICDVGYYKWLELRDAFACRKEQATWNRNPLDATQSSGRASCMCFGAHRCVERIKRPSERALLYNSAIRNIQLKRLPEKDKTSERREALEDAYAKGYKEAWEKPVQQSEECDGKCKHMCLNCFKTRAKAAKRNGPKRRYIQGYLDASKDKRRIKTPKWQRIRKHAPLWLGLRYRKGVWRRTEGDMAPFKIFFQPCEVNPEIVVPDLDPGDRNTHADPTTRATRDVRSLIQEYLEEPGRQAWNNGKGIWRYEEDSRQGSVQPRFWTANERHQRC